MKKTIKIILICMLCVIMFTTCVKAEDEACKITLSADKTTIKAGEEVTITLTMKNITKTSGIVEFTSILQILEDVFEIQFIEDEELKEDLETLGIECDVLYNGENDTDTSIKNPWYLIAIEEDGQYGIYGATAGDPQIESQVVGKIKLKAKKNAKTAQVKIGLSEVEVVDAEGMSGSTENYTIADSEIKLQVTGTTNGTNTSNNTQKNNVTTNKTTQNKVQNENKATGTAPYTGIEDYIPFIFIGIIISVIAYINYQKYKNI